MVVEQEPVSKNLTLRSRGQKTDDQAREMSFVVCKMRRYFINSYISLVLHFARHSTKHISFDPHDLISDFEECYETLSFHQIWAFTFVLELAC